MNGAFVHLTLNHIPVVGMPFAFLLLLAGVLRSSDELTQAGLIEVILVALITIPAYKSGGPAAHMLKGIPGIVHADIHRHAEAADWAFRLAILLGALSAISLWLWSNSKAAAKSLTLLVLLGALGASAWLGWVAHLGGLIRHPEISQDFVPPPPPPDQPAPQK